MPFTEPHGETRVFIKFQCPLHGQKPQLGYYSEGRKHTTYSDSRDYSVSWPLKGGSTPIEHPFTRLQYKRVGISQVEVQEGGGGGICHLGISKGLKLRHFEHTPMWL